MGVERTSRSAVHPRRSLERTVLHGRGRRCASTARSRGDKWIPVRQGIRAVVGGRICRADSEKAPITFANRKPVDDATFEVFRRFYSYEPAPLDARNESVQESEFWRRERVSFAAAYSGERVPVNILIPRNTSPPYQAVVWFPGSYALGLKHSDGDLPFSYYFDFLPRSGRALVYPVYKGTYERAKPAENVSQQSRPGSEMVAGPGSDDRLFEQPGRFRQGEDCLLRFQHGR